MAYYKYEPLDHSEDEIRLLQIDLNGPDHEYEIKSNVSLRRSKPQYWALSYFWGEFPKEEWTNMLNNNVPDSKKMAKIEIVLLNGKVAPVSLNLHRALHRIRAYFKEYPGASRDHALLWCDQ